jgi:hypothetical protein
MTTVVLEATGLGHINSGAATATSGTNDRTGFIPTGEFGGSQLNRAWLLFDIWHLPSDAVVSAASIDLSISAGADDFGGANHTLNMYRLRRRAWSGAGDTSGATAGHPDPKCSWNNYDQNNALAWSTAGAANTTTDRESAAIGSHTVNSTDHDNATLTFTLDTTKVQEWLSGAFTNHGLLLQASVETNTLIRWKTIDDATAANRPRLSITYTSATEALAITSGVVAHYRLDDTADASGNAHTLTNNNAATFVAGKVGNAAHFVAASTQSLSNDDAALKAGSGDFTVCFWAKLTDLADFYTAASQWRDANAGDGLGSGWRLFYHKQSVLDYYVAQINDATGNAEVADVIGYSSGAIGSAGTYIMVTVRHDAARKILHLGFNDQMAKANSSGPHTGGDQWGPYEAIYIPATSAFRIGAQTSTGSGVSQPFNGDIDALTYWSRWLTDAEVTTLYNGGAGMELTFEAAPTVVLPSVYYAPVYRARTR